MTPAAFPLTAKQMLVGAMDRLGSRPALVFAGRTLTYGEIVTQSNRLGHALLGLGVGPGEPVAVLLPNGPEYVIADQAIARIGAAKVALSDMLSPAEIAYCLGDCGARVAIAQGAMLQAAVGSGSASLEAVIAVPDADAADLAPATDETALRVLDLDAALAGMPGTLPEQDPDEDDLALIIYTGGTTGRSKGVLHRQRGIALNLQSHLIESGVGDDERMLLMSPLPHSAGFLLQTAFLRGALVYLERRFDPDLVLRRISRDRVSFVFMVPTMIYRVLDAAAAAARSGLELDLSSLRTILYGAAPITQDRLEQGLAVLGRVFVQLYGQSEAPNFITRLRREDHDTSAGGRHRLGSCGRTVAMAAVRIVDPEEPTLRALPTGQVGEVIAATPYTMAGYHQLPAATAKSLRDGWLFTGDIGRLDEDGYLYLLDRKNDMIITGGMNVYSTEVETVIAGVAGVQRVAVIGIPHDDWGEAVVACVVGARHDPDGLLSAITATCRAELAKYKVPKEIRLYDALPLTIFGKLDKKALRAGWTIAAVERAAARP